jgi:hypothetical protein
VVKRSNRVCRAFFRKSKYLIQGLILVPGCHYRLVCRNVSKIEFSKVGPVDRVVPNTAVLTPCQHVQTTTVQYPVTDAIAPFVRYFSIDYDNKFRRSTVECRRIVLWSQVNVSRGHNFFQIVRPLVAEIGSCIRTIVPYRYTHARRRHRDNFRFSRGLVQHFRDIVTRLSRPERDDDHRLRVLSISASKPRWSASRRRRLQAHLQIARARPPGHLQLIRAQNGVECEHDRFEARAVIASSDW